MLELRAAFPFRILPFSDSFSNLGNWNLESLLFLAECFVDNGDLKHIELHENCILIILAMLFSREPYKLRQHAQVG